MNIKLFPDEIWLPVVGFEKQYKVSNYSRIYSMGYKRILTPNKITDRDRYKRIRLSNRIVREMHAIHIISAIAFIPNPDPILLTDVNHKDDDRENNHISNFEWTTHRENINHGNITRNSLSKFVGVSPKNDKWRARIYHNKKHIQIGTYTTEELASAAYQGYCVKNGISLKYVA